MPVIKTVSVGYSRKINLGDFNSAQVDCSIWAQIIDGDDEGEVMQALWSMAKENVKAQVLPLKARDAKAIDLKETFLGLPMETHSPYTVLDNLPPKPVEAEETPPPF